MTTPTATAKLDSIIEVSGVTKSYGSAHAQAHALCKLDVVIQRGQFVSVMGPSGSGKSTLLNLIAGLDTPDEGQVIVLGNDLRTLRDHQLARMRLHTLGFIFQSFNLIPALTVRDNIAWPLEFSGCSRSETRERVADALRRVGIVNREKRYPAELAGGEQQRVAIARAIVTRPALLLADEPTGNLDSHTGRLILDLLRSLNQSDGMTVVMVTHNVFAATYGDRTLELHDGRIVRDVSTPAREPASTEQESGEQ